MPFCPMHIFVVCNDVFLQKLRLISKLNAGFEVFLESGDRLSKKM